MESRTENFVPTERVEQTPLGQLQPYRNNARTHSAKQIKQIARSIERFGFVNPVLADANGQIIAGHGRVEAAKQLGLKSVPVLRIEHLTPAAAQSSSCGACWSRPVTP